MMRSRPRQARGEVGHLPNPQVFRPLAPFATVLVVQQQPFAIFHRMLAQLLAELRQVLVAALVPQLMMRK